MALVRRSLAALALAWALTAGTAGVRAQEPIDLDEKVVGSQPVTVSAPGAARVTYALDGRKIGTASVAAGTAELRVDFGTIPFPHTLTLAAYDAAGALLGERQHRVNIGGRGADLVFLEPSNGARAGTGANVTVCARLPPRETIANAIVTAGGDPWTLEPTRDRRCDGAAYRTVVPAADVRYLEAQVTTTGGRALTDAVAVNQVPGAFGERVTVRLFQYLVRPIGGDGRVITDLDAASFAVREDRTPLPVQSVTRVTDAPLDLAIVFDASISTAGDAALEEALVESALSLLDLAKDHAIVYAIGDRPVPLLSQWSGDRAAIERALRRAVRLETSNHTAAYDTLEEVLYRFQAAAHSGIAAGAVLYMTDGDDTVEPSSSKDRREDRLLRYAQASGVQVFPISVELPLPAPEPRCELLGINRVAHGFLDALAARTGGERTMLTLGANPAPFLRRAEDLATELKRLRDQGTESALLQAQRRGRCVDEYRKRFEDQVRRAAVEPPIAGRISDAIVGVGAAMRQQYVVAFQVNDDARPRERSLRFEIDDTRVKIVRAPIGVYY